MRMSLRPWCGARGVARAKAAAAAGALAALALSLSVGAADRARAQDTQVFTLVITNNRFDVEELVVPAGKRFELVIRNQDATPEEFESSDMRVEKAVPGRGELRLTVGPLDAGRYYFFGDYHEATAKGYVVAK